MFWIRSHTKQDFVRLSTHNLNRKSKRQLNNLGYEDFSVAARMYMLDFEMEFRLFFEDAVTLTYAVTLTCVVGSRMSQIFSDSS